MIIRFCKWFSLSPVLRGQILRDLFGRETYNLLMFHGVTYEIEDEKKAKMLILKYPGIIEEAK